MMKRGRVMRLAAAVVCLLLAAGCWDQREIEERTSVVAVGIDAEPGDEKLIRVTIQMPIPLRIAGSRGGGGGGDPVKVMSATGRTTIEAFNKLQNQVNQQLFYGHTRVIAIGEELARRGVNAFMDPFRRDPQIRRLLWPLVVKGKAADLLTVKPEAEQIPTVYIMTMIENGAKTGRIPDMNLGEFYIALTSKADEPFLNYVEVTDGDVKWRGVAVFKGDRMAGALNEQETWMLLRLRQKENGAPIVFAYRNDPNLLLSFSTETTSVKRTIGYGNGRVNVAVRLRLEGDLIGKTFDTDFAKQANIKELERYAEAYLKKQTGVMLRKLQREYKSDILGIGDRVRAFYPGIWRKVDWDRAFPEAKIQVSYDVKLRRTGMEME